MNLGIPAAVRTNHQKHTDAIANKDDDKNNNNNNYGGIVSVIIVMNSDSGKPIYSWGCNRSKKNGSTSTSTSSNNINLDNDEGTRISSSMCLSSQIATICSIIHTLQTLSFSSSVSVASNNKFNHHHHHYSTAANTTTMKMKVNEEKQGLGHLQSIIIHTTCSSNNNNDSIANDRIVFMNVPTSRFTFIVLTTTTLTTTTKCVCFFDVGLQIATNSISGLELDDSTV